MSSVMFYGVLNMPYDMVMADEISRVQFYGRAREAAAIVERMVERLQAAKLQIQYMQDKFHETGSGNAEIAKINELLADFL